MSEDIEPVEIYYEGRRKRRNKKSKNSKSKEVLEDGLDIEESESSSSLSDMNNLQLDGIMKTSPDYPVAEELCEKEDENLNNTTEPSIIIENDAINTRALDQYAKTYELEKFDKNYLMIFNQKYIINYPARIGTEKDVKALKDTFSKYKFECYDYHDLTKNEIMEKLKIFETKDFTEYGCVAVVVLTHGNYNGLLRAKDREYNETELINYFKIHDKPTLITKPKLLIIQACRGERLTSGMAVMRSAHMRMDQDTEVESYTLPIESDMLILHSSYIGCPSIRSEVNGSWFIQKLCKKIEECSENLDLESILTIVKRQVAINLHYYQYNRITEEEDVYKQMPVITSTLIRKLYLRKRNEEEVTLTDAQLCCSTLGEQPEATISLRPVGQCICYLYYFAYMRDCLSYFVEENPEDNVAQSFLEISNTFEDTEDFNASKERMARAICNHLKNNATRHEYYKFIYMHKH